MKHEDAVKIAMEVVVALKPVCTIINVAGSVRRLKPEVKDIEIVALVPMDLRTSMFLILDKFCYHKKGMGKGRQMQWQHKASGIVIDLFLPTESDYYRIFAIRTGSAEYTQRVIAGGWVKKGWVGTDSGLRLRTECGKVLNKWVCTADEPTLPPEWKSEKEFFHWLGAEWIEPKERGIY